MLGLKLPLSVFAATATMLLTVPQPKAQEATAEAIVDAQFAAAGNRKNTRPSNAKGTCAKGGFTPTAEAAAMSKAPIFAKPTPVTARLTMGGGNPNIADTVKGATRGFSMRFDHDGDTTNILMISAPIFGVSTPEQLLGALQAGAPGPNGQPDPAKAAAFRAANPNTLKQGAWLAARPVPASWAGTNYWAVTVYTLTNAKNEATTIKFKAVPTGGEVNLTDDEVKAKPANYYADDLKEKLAKGPVTFDLMAIVAQPGDVTNDSTATWPEESRRSVKLGTVAISEIVPNATCDAFTFDPVILPDGMAGQADDPLFDIRSEAYARSLTRRQ